jgi:hypothetical protein
MSRDELHLAFPRSLFARQQAEGVVQTVGVRKPLGSETDDDGVNGRGRGGRREVGEGGGGEEVEGAGRVPRREDGKRK